jgi:putative transcriptional regulator
LKDRDAAPSGGFEDGSDGGIVGDELILGMENAVAHARGIRRAVRETAVRVTALTMDVARIRHKLGLSQRRFALQFGFTVQSVRNWEQGIRQPEGPARVLLTVIDRNPDAVREALGEDGGAA